MDIKKYLRIPDDQRIYHFLIFLALAITFWLFTALNRDTVADLYYSVTYENVPFGKHLLQDAPSELRLKIKGKGLDIMIERIKHSTDPIVIDLSDKKLTPYTGSGRMVIPSQSFYKMFLPRLGDKLNIRNFSPDVVTLSFVDKYTRLVPVSIPYELNYGMALGLAAPPSPVPAEVRITGPAELIDQITMLYTDTLTLAKTDNKYSGRIKLQGTLNELVDMELQEVDYSISLEEYTEKVFRLPVFKNSEQVSISEITVVPEKVLVKVLVPVSKYDQVSENDLNVFINIDENNRKQRKLPVSVKTSKEHISHIRTIPERVFCLYEKDG